jgi:hypothetical protein
MLPSYVFILFIIRFSKKIRGDLYYILIECPVNLPF